MGLLPGFESLLVKGKSLCWESYETSNQLTTESDFPGDQSKLYMSL